jgi:hypothetical protein
MEALAIAATSASESGSAANVSAANVSAMASETATSATAPAITGGIVTPEPRSIREVPLAGNGERQVDDRLRELVHMWYFSTHPNMRLPFNNLLSADVVNQWMTMWFAKGNDQVTLDAKLQPWAESMEAFDNHEPRNLTERMALVRQKHVVAVPRPGRCSTWGLSNRNVFPHVVIS